MSTDFQLKFTEIDSVDRKSILVNIYPVASASRTDGTDRPPGC